MGFFDFLFGGSDESRIEKLKKKADARELAAYLKHEDKVIRRKAVDALAELVEGGKLTQTDEKSIMEIIDPIIRIKDRRLIDAIEDAYELRNVAINDYLKKRDIDMAVYALNRALKLKPGDINLRNNLAAAYSRGDRFEKAQEIWEQILKDSPEDKSALDNYVTALYIQGDRILKKKDEKAWAQGADNLIKALELNPNHVNCMQVLAEYFEKTKNFDKAIYYYKKIMNNARVPTGYSSAGEMRGYMCRAIAKVYREMENQQEAVNFYQQALSVFMWDEVQRLQIEETLKELGG